MTAINAHDRIVTPDTDPDRFDEEETAIFREGKCGWVVEYGNGRGIIHCLKPSKPDASFGNCEKHEAVLLEEFYADGTYRPLRDR